MKFHLSPFENVIEQTKAMQAVAPSDFQIHYDFTMSAPCPTVLVPPRSRAPTVSLFSCPLVR